jgi:flagellar hook-associated protein 3 FlgL
MRITEGRIASDFLTSVNKNRESIVTLQSQLASGKKVMKVSDDPIAADAILRLQAGLDRNDQYQKNVTDGQGALESTASYLDSMVSLVSKAKTIVVQSQDGQQVSSMKAYGDQLNQMINEGITIGNAQFNGKYIFAGTKTTTSPYSLSATTPQTVVFNGDANNLMYPTGDSFQQQVSVSGAEAFGGTALFDTMIRIRDSLTAGTPPAAADVAALSQSMDTLTQTSSKVGSLMQSLDSQANHLTEQTSQLRSLLSGEQDTDVAEATLKLKLNQTMLDAALNTGSQILPKSLLDFLR